MRKVIVVAVVVATGLLATYFASPYWTFYQMRVAAKEGDGQRLAAYVDFPAVRESMKSQFANELAKRRESQANANAFAAVGQALATQMVNGLIDAMVTPEAVAMMIRSGKAPRPAFETRTAAKQTNTSEAREPQLRRGYDGLNSFQASLVNPQTSDPMLTAVLSRQGVFTWKLTSVELSTASRR